MLNIDWKKDYKLGEFACPNPECHAKRMKHQGLSSAGKHFFKCQDCGATTVQSKELTKNNLSRYAHHLPPIKPFSFQQDSWDLRGINPSFEQQDSRIYVNFQMIQLDWFRDLVKRYIYHLCKLNKSFGTIDKNIGGLRAFSRYLERKTIKEVEEINRELILDFISSEKTGINGIRNRLSALRDFFLTGNLQGWFDIEQDIIKDEDYPKISLGNPDPISDSVREKIEKNLHQLPPPIARMWMIAFFTAMRPSELALLKKDCLVQEGSHWKIVWQRRKMKDYHEVPITRVIAKVIQEQLEYIENLWGNDWDYLFCHYQGFSRIDLSHPKLQPVKKIIPRSGNPLQIAICCLIKALDIRDDNGELAKFSSRLVRPTRLTQLFEQGHDLAVVSAWAGHQTLATTSTYYTHISCDLIEKETGHLQKALFNADGQPLHYESLPKSFWKNPCAHQLELSGDHINTPIYGYCGLPLEQRCDKFRACYTCPCFVAVPEKLTQYVKTRDELRAKESRARASGADVLVEQYQRQAEQLDKIIASLEDAA